MLYLVHEDGLISSSGKTLDYFPKAVHPKVQSKDEILALPEERLREICERNDDIIDLDSKDVVEKVSQLLDRLTLQEIPVAKKGKGVKPTIEKKVSDSIKQTVKVQKKVDREPKVRSPRLDKSLRINVLTEDNPKRPNSLAFTRFKLYKNGMTVGDFLNKGGTIGDIHFDKAKGYISLSE